MGMEIEDNVTRVDGREKGDEMVSGRLAQAKAGNLMRQKRTQLTQIA
jgi:hypothetical protein